MDSGATQTSAVPVHDGYALTGGTCVRSCMHLCVGNSGIVPYMACVPPLACPPCPYELVVILLVELRYLLVSTVTGYFRCFLFDPIASVFSAVKRYHTTVGMDMLNNLLCFLFSVVQLTKAFRSKRSVHWLFMLQKVE